MTGHVIYEEKSIIPSVTPRSRKTSSQAPKLGGTVQWHVINTRGRLAVSGRSSTALQPFEKTIKIHANLKKALLFFKYVAAHFRSSSQGVQKSTLRQ